MKTNCSCAGLRLVTSDLCPWCKYPLLPTVALDTITESTPLERIITGPEVRAAYEKSGRNLAMTGKLLFPDLPVTMAETLAARLVRQHTQG